MIELKKSPVTFRDADHTYWLGDKQLKGITSTLIRRAFPNKYKDIDPEVLANAARKGKELHEAIEYHDHFGGEPQDPRIALYERIKAENNLTTIENEYLVSDEAHYATQIDLLQSDQNDNLCITEIKSTYTLDLESAALQTSIGKVLFEQQNPNTEVKRLFVIYLPNRDTTIAEIHELQFVGYEVVQSLIEADLADKPFDITETYGDLPVVLRSAEDEVIRIENEMKQMKARQDELKRGLYELMEQHNIKSFESEKIRLTRVLPTTSETFDTKRFAEQHPELYKQFTKTSQRAGSLKITILKN